MLLLLLAVLRIECTVPQFTTADCDSGVRTTALTPISVYWHILGPVSFSATDANMMPGTHLVRSWTVPPGVYTAIAQTKNKVGWGCDTTAYFVVTDPPSAPFIHR